MGRADRRDLLNRLLPLPGRLSRFASNPRRASGARFRGPIRQGLAESCCFGQWTEVTVPLSSLTPEFRGQKLSGPPLDRSRIEEIGLSLSDGKPGAFALEIDWIKAG